MSKVTRAAFVDAAKELNDVLDLDPHIDVTLGVKEIRDQMVVAVSYLRDDDKVSDDTRNIVAALTSDEQDAPADADESDDVVGEAQCGDANEVEIAPASVSTKKAKAAVKAKPAKEPKTRKAVIKNADLSTLPNGSAMPRPGSKREIILKLIQRSNGVTADELRAATGWDEARGTAKRLADAHFGKLIKTETEGQPARYRMVVSERDSVAE